MKYYLQTKSGLSMQYKKGIEIKALRNAHYLPAQHLYINIFVVMRTLLLERSAEAALCRSPLSLS